MPPVLSIEEFVFDPRPDYPLLITAKRYRDPLSNPGPDALTCVCTHGSGFNKECWETTIEHIFECARDGKVKVDVKEIWSIDAPNHGDAAVLNEVTLRRGYIPIFQWEEYARGLHAFLMGLGTGLGDIKLGTQKNLVGIGHSMGASAIMLSTTFLPRVRYRSVHLVEPMLLPLKFELSPNPLEGGAERRRDIWANEEEAYSSLKPRLPFKHWKDTELRNYVKYGLRPLPTETYPDKTGVTLKCTRVQETAILRDQHGRARSYGYLPAFLKRFRTHVMYGAIDDLVSKPAKVQVLNEGSGGIENFAGIWTIPDSGHLVLQNNPLGTARAITDALTTDHLPLAKL